jgi:adenylate cyclase
MCDLRGFTELSKSRQILSVIELLNAWFDCIATAVGKHDGEILKFMGDGLLVVFRADGDFAKACRRALAAAIDARNAVAALNGERDYFGERPIDFVMGIHAGEVAYGNVGSRRRLDFTVLGPAVNYASRLQDLAKRLNQPALISREFAAMAPGEFSDLGVHPLRGIGKAEQVYALPLMRLRNAST